MNKFVHILKLGWAYKIVHSTKLSYPPYQYTIEPTNICNLKCVFCPQSDPDHSKIRKTGFLSMENLCLFFDKIKIAGGGNRNINFTLDGEPFLNKDFPEMLKLAHHRSYFPIFASNGTLFDQKAADIISKSGPFRVSIDFGSDEKIFETIRGKSGHFRRILENLNYLIERARTNSNVQVDIHDVTPYAGADPETSLENMRSLFPADLPENIKLLSRQFHNFCGHLEAKSKTRNYRLCPYPWTQMAVTWEGNCVPCCRDTSGRSVLGNLTESPIMEIWNSSQYQQFRRNLLDRKPELNAACRNCDLPYSVEAKRWHPRYILRSLLGR